MDLRGFELSVFYAITKETLVVGLPVLLSPTRGERNHCPLEPPNIAARGSTGPAGLLHGVRKNKRSE